MEIIHFVLHHRHLLIIIRAIVQKMINVALEKFTLEERTNIQLT